MPQRIIAFLASYHSGDPLSCPMTVSSRMLLIDETAACAMAAAVVTKVSKSVSSQPTRVHSLDATGFVAARTARAAAVVMKKVSDCNNMTPTSELKKMEERKGRNKKFSGH